eukprot:scaffold260686_cov24-Tisochrysis_lutea.AAC.1
MQCASVACSLRAEAQEIAVPASKEAIASSVAALICLLRAGSSIYLPAVHISQPGAQEHVSAAKQMVAACGRP